MKKTPNQAAKRQETKPFNVEDYVRWDLSAEEVKEIKQAFDIFDNDLSGIMDPSELKDAFINLGFTGQCKFVYQILAELDEDQSGGIEFPEFLKLATAKLSDKDSREDIMKIFNTFDVNRAVLYFITNSRVNSPASNSKKSPRTSEKTSTTRTSKT